MSTTIQFTDGAGYERYMGRWSQLAGRAFLEWLAPGSGLRWLDVGCGNGAFTELIYAHCAPSSVDGIDPSDAQLAFARQRATTALATFHQGNAMALPFGDQHFDLAVMPLVITFVPDPAKGVSEMARVVRPGGWVGAYMWDQTSAGFPYHALITELRAMGVDVPSTPSSDASHIDRLRQLWTDAGLTSIDTREIRVQRTFESFDDYWATVQLGPSVGPPIARMNDADRARLQGRMRDVLRAEADGRITYDAHANAVKGEVAAPCGQ